MFQVGLDTYCVSNTVEVGCIFNCSSGSNNLGSASGYAHMFIRSMSFEPLENDLGMLTDWFIL